MFPTIVDRLHGAVLHQRARAYVRHDIRSLRQQSFKYPVDPFAYAGGADQYLQVPSSDNFVAASVQCRKHYFSLNIEDHQKLQLMMPAI